MNTIFRPGAGVIFMKVGTHAQEPLADIIKRKSKEIEDAGVAFWGYGGNTCHPQTMVQPFAKTFEEKGETIHLCMEEMESKHYADRVRADEYSEDGIVWKPIPPQINVLGSRHALVLRSLCKADFDIPLDQTRVAVGNTMGRIGSRYVQGRVDKACLEVLPHRELINQTDQRIVHIGLVAEIAPPYAVFLRNK